MMISASVGTGIFVRPKFFFEGIQRLCLPGIPEEKIQQEDQNHQQMAQECQALRKAHQQNREDSSILYKEDLFF